jgi:hypothetical protein
MNRALPPGDRGDRSGAESRKWGYTGSMLSALGLVGGGVAHPERKTPPGVNPAARCERKGSVSGFDGVAALSVLALGGRNGQAHFLPYGSRKETTQGMRLPTGRFEQFLGGGAARPLQQVQDGRGFAALTGVVSCAFGRFLLRAGLLPRLTLGGRDVR